MQQVTSQESELTRYALERLGEIRGIRVFGDSNPSNSINRLGVVPIQLDQVSHFLAAAILGYEFGIGVRSGCFCDHPYILHLLGLSNEQAADVRKRILDGDRADMPGLIRISFGLYNTIEDVDIIVDALKHISTGAYKGKFIQDKATGEYSPIGWKPNYSDYFYI